MIEGRGLFLSVIDSFRFSFIFVARFIRFVDPSSTCRIMFRVLSGVILFLLIFQDILILIKTDIMDFQDIR